MEKKKEAYERWGGGGGGGGGAVSLCNVACRVARLRDVTQSLVGK